ncbi:MmcQ/YjbR family DNA-binding protein [Bradyrhizobium sp. LHD-71]|uniref:MmcQ/YjbR family DNA-binding protein n=1 Tax=Bradyrhizobium sp. LHD-71 TaxID=3072141 RepID=UPI00280E446F|nr:MmcQ/YjbR family DNA-binding protein [Bradyrhizobium sp. LHD-71]MDQ8730376.1 MmcQ/YjbR family DNA-binding protein [Bradyrhizobium sp. LHD-71]
MPKRKVGMTYPSVEKMLLGWPGVELSSSYGRPSLKVNGKFFTWVKEDGDSILIGGIDFDERDMLMETRGEVFYITDHYRNSRCVLMRLSKADPETVEALLWRRWRQIAPKKLQATYSETPATAKPRPVTKNNARKGRRQLRRIRS